jgi:hypothetical protein
VNKKDNKKRKIEKEDRTEEEIKTARLQGQRKSKKMRNRTTRTWRRKF